MHISYDFLCGGPWSPNVVSPQRCEPHKPASCLSFGLTASVRVLISPSSAWIRCTYPTASSSRRAAVLAAMDSCRGDELRDGSGGEVPLGDARGGLPGAGLGGRRGGVLSLGLQANSLGDAAGLLSRDGERLDGDRAVVSLACTASSSALSFAIATFLSSSSCWSCFAFSWLELIAHSTLPFPLHSP